MHHGIATLQYEKILHLADYYIDPYFKFKIINVKKRSRNPSTAKMNDT